MDYTFLIPCFNEEKTIGICIADIRKKASELRLDYEILVVDNNSSDNSADIARKYDANVDFSMNVNDSQIGEASDNVFGTAFNYDGDTHVLEINEIAKEEELGDDFVEVATDTTDTENTEVTQAADGTENADSTESSDANLPEAAPAKKYIYKEGFACYISDVDTKDANGDLIDKTPVLTEDSAEAVTNPLQFSDAGDYVFYFEVKAKGYNKFFGKINIHVNKVDMPIKATNVLSYYYYDESNGNSTKYGTDSMTYYVPIYIECNTELSTDEVNKDKFVETNIAANKDNEYLSVNPEIDGNLLVVNVKPKKEGTIASTSLTLVRPESTNFKESSITIPYTIGAADGLFNEEGALLANYAELVNSYNLDITKNLTNDNYKTDDNSLYNLLNNKTLTIDVDNDTHFGPSIYENAVQFKVPSSVKQIGSYAFKGCSQLKNIMIPDSVNKIGDDAFDSDMTICYNGQTSDNLWGAKHLHLYGDDNKCKYCGAEKSQSETTDAGNDSSESTNDNDADSTSESSADSADENESVNENTENNITDTESSNLSFPAIGIEGRELLRKLGQVINTAL